MELKRFALAMVGHFLASLLYVLQRLHIVNAVVDTTSILEHREELRELWEKRMMADDNQSSPSSAVEEKTKPLAEEAKEGEVKAHSEDETTKLQQNHVCNGFAKTDSEEITDAHHDQKVPEGSLIQVLETSMPTGEDDHENNNNTNSADSLELDNNNEVYVEEKTYTSQLETSLVVKQVTEVTKEDHVVETIHNETVSDETVTTTLLEGDGQSVISAATEEETVKKDTTEKETSSPVLVAIDEKILSVEDHIPSVAESEKETHADVLEIHEETVIAHKEENNHEMLIEIDTVCGTAAPMKSLEIPTPTDEEGDGFVPLAQCLPLDDEHEDGHDVLDKSPEKNAIAEEHKVEVSNGYAEHVESSPTISTPEPSLDEKANHPEMEQFLKSGGVKRILPGVQKTEQPYSSCTTETKIAMEIREMREREEELRIMREQAVLSPVVSPVPPKSPVGRSPSPSVKECVSPTPAGPGYRVSSVFGHRAVSVSPSPPVITEDEKKAFKATKESAVEKEIRLARDREEELRKQKGLPPREDDSYVKPSQVKSSQVRIFGKAANNASVKQAATAKIQMEIEEQTQREMALRDTGSIQTISQERTDAKVAKLATESTTPPLTNGNSQPHTNGNGNHTNGRHSPDVAPYKRSSPSPTGLTGRPASIFSQTNGKSNINMQKFIASKGKETAFTAPRNGNSPFVLTKEDRGTVVPPAMVKLKRTVSVESKIQQEIMEMKQREEELKKLHMNRNNNENSNGHDENGKEYEMNEKNNLMEYENGINVEEDISPRHNKLIAQWEQRIQKAES